MARLNRPFDPLRSGEVDVFAFDFTSDIGNSYINGTSWTCQLVVPNLTVDPDPQSRVLGVYVQQSALIRNPDGSTSTIAGNFSLATIGNLPDTAIGATYVVEATATLADGRILKLSATLPCVGA